MTTCKAEVFHKAVHKPPGLHTAVSGNQAWVWRVRVSTVEL